MFNTCLPPSLSRGAPRAQSSMATSTKPSSEPTRRARPETVTKRLLLSFFHTSTLCDASITTLDQHTIPLCTPVVSAASPYLKAILDPLPSKPPYVPFSRRIFRAALEFIYSNSCNDLRQLDKSSTNAPFTPPSISDLSALLQLVECATVLSLPNLRLWSLQIAHTLFTNHPSLITHALNLIFSPRNPSSDPPLPGNKTSILTTLHPIIRTHLQSSLFSPPSPVSSADFQTPASRFLIPLSAASMRHLLSKITWRPEHALQIIYYWASPSIHLFDHASFHRARIHAAHNGAVATSYAARLNSHSITSEFIQRCVVHSGLLHQDAVPDGWKISQMPVSTSRKRTSVPNGLPPPKVARVADTAPSETQQNNRRRAEMPASTERAVADSRREREPPVVTSPFYCSFCVQSFCTETTYVRHGKSQKHKDHVKLRAKFRSVELHLEKHAIVSISPLLWMCMLCRCGIDGELAVARHVGSVKHVELMKRGIPSHIKADVERRLKAAALDNNIRSTVQQGRRYAAMSNKVAINDRPMLNDRATMNETMNESASTPAVIEIDGAVESTAEEEDSVKDVLDISTDVSGVDVVSEQSCVSTLRGLNYCSLPADETLNYIKKRDRTMRKQFMCMICNKPLEHMGIQIHLKSKRHRQEEQELKVFQEESKMKIMRPIGRELRCEICNLSYFSVVRYLEHLRQMLHANRVRAICSVDHALDGEGVKGHWSCARCFFFCFDIMSYDAHCRGHIHRKYVSAREKHNNVMLQNGNGGNGPDGSFRNITKLEWEDIWREAAEKEKKRKLKRRAKKRKWKARQKGPGAKEGSSNSGMKQNA